MQFSLGDIISGDKKIDESSSTNVFSSVVSKPAPKYDYSVVPERKRDLPEPDFEVPDGFQVRTKKVKSEQADNTTSPTAKLKNKTKKKKEPGENVTAGKKDKNEKSAVLDPEKEGRTVFVGNLPTSTDKKKLSKMFSEFGKVETIRFRCAARPDLQTSKKVAVIQKKFHEDRSNICAYVRFSSVAEAKSSCSLNSQQIGNNTIRVDLALNSTGQHDQSKAIFLGNLDFKTHEDDVREAFRGCGDIEGVRLIRDSVIGIGKGFGYVNFGSKDSVETALAMEGNVEVRGRKVRISRAVRKPKQAGTGTSQTTAGDKRKGRPGEDTKKATFQQRFNKKKAKLEKVQEKKFKADAVKTTSKKKPPPSWKPKKEAESFQGVVADKKKSRSGKLSKEQLKKRFIARKLLG